MNTPIEQLEVVDLTNLYWVIGSLIVMNFGTIVTVLAGAGRALWWVSKLDSRVENNTKDIHNAYKKIRRIEDVALFDET